MNIFAVSHDPAECAKVLDDKRLNKMTTETAQLLSTAIHEWDESVDFEVYKPTHRSHPCALWVREQFGHFDWTFRLFTALGAEWKTRKGKVHGAVVVIDAAEQVYDRHLSSVGTPPEPVYWCNCTPYSDRGVHAAYRQLLCDKWCQDIANGRPPRWTNRQPPEWWQG